MRNGMYFVSFTSNVNDAGTGIVVVSNGTIHGGDDNYLYTGTFAAYSNVVTARLKVSHYRGLPNSIFGPLSVFHLSLEGTATDSQFELNGTVIESPSLRIQISGEKISELVPSITQ